MEGDGRAFLLIIFRAASKQTRGKRGRRRGSRCSLLSEMPFIVAALSL